MRIPPGIQNSLGSSLALLTRYTYDTAGRQESVISGVRKNGNNTVTTTTKTFYDVLGRRTYVAENWVDFVPPTTDIGGGTNNEEDRVTLFLYNGSGNLTFLVAYNAGLTGQVTQYFYENAYDARLLTKTVYPDGNPLTGDNVQMTYNLDGTLATRTDQRGVVLTYTYDNARRLSIEGATTIPTGVDDHVKSIRRFYDGFGRLYGVRSFANANGTGTIRNDINLTYNSHGNVWVSKQSHEGAVITGTPSVQYAYDASVQSGVYDDGLRLETVTYPSGRVILFGRNAIGTIDRRLGRLYRLWETDGSGNPTTILSEYSYNGTGRLVMSDYQPPDVKLDLYGGTAGTYASFDRFGRTKFQPWHKYSSPTGTRDRWNYTYDYADNRLTRDLDPAQVSGAPTDHDQVYMYDGLQRLANFQQGTIGSGIIVTKTFEQDWTLDQLGNWPTFKHDSDGNGFDFTQTRTHNAVNELETISNWANPAYDAAGNMTTMPHPLSPTDLVFLKYDAWNRLVTFSAPLVGPLVTFEYDGLHQRIVKERSSLIGGGTYDYYYNEQWQVLEERKNGDPDPLAQYVWHPYYIDALAVRYYDANTDGSGIVRHWYLQDANFNVTAVVDDSGAAVERYAYTPYGEVTILDANFAVDADQVSDIDNNHLYTGRERDPETGLYNFRTRYYHAQLGRFTTRDWIRYWGGMNLYGYGDSMPTVSVDPFGFDPTRSIYENGDWRLAFWAWLEYDCDQAPTVVASGTSGLVDNWTVGVVGLDITVLAARIVDLETNEECISGRKKVSYKGKIELIFEYRVNFGDLKFVRGISRELTKKVFINFTTEKLDCGECDECPPKKEPPDWLPWPKPRSPRLVPVKPLPRPTPGHRG